MWRDWVAEPDSDAGDVDGAAVDEVAFVGAGGDRAVLTELVDGPFDGVAFLVPFGVEGRGSAALGTAGLAPGYLVRWLRDRRADVPAAQHSADLARGVRLVRQDPIRAGAGPTDPGDGTGSPRRYGSSCSARPGNGPGSPGP